MKFGNEEPFLPSDDGFAVLFCEKYEGTVRYVVSCPRRRLPAAWLLKDGAGVWEHDETLMVQAMMRDVIRNAGFSPRSGQIISALRFVSCTRSIVTTQNEYKAILTAQTPPPPKPQPTPQPKPKPTPRPAKAIKAPKPTMTGEMVYALGSPETALVKIGRSIDVHRRIGDIQRMGPVKLGLLWSFIGGNKLEKALHKAFAERRVHGEWFDFSDTNDVVGSLNDAVASWERYP